jgi:branched-chain amino acid transport system substrate-binding protein
VKLFRLLAAVGAVGTLTVLSGSGAYGGSVQTGSIKIGVLTSLTGPFTNWGIQTRAGMALAVNEINRGGGVKGRGQRRLLNLVVADDQSSPNAGIDGFRRLTQQEDVVAVGGLISSDVALATARSSSSRRVRTRFSHGIAATRSAPVSPPQPRLRFLSSSSRSDGG